MAASTTCFCGRPADDVCPCCAGTCEHVDAQGHATCVREPLLDVAGGVSLLPLPAQRAPGPASSPQVGGAGGSVLSSLTCPVCGAALTDDQVWLWHINHAHGSTRAPRPSCSRWCGQQYRRMRERAVEARP